MPVRKTTTTTTTTTVERGYGSPHYRFNAWVALMVLSLVSFVAIIAAADPPRDFQEKWSLAMAGISMCLGFLASIGHAVFALREKFVSTLTELAMAIISVGCWILALPMITTPDDGLAVNHNFQIDNANLYFASWGAFIFAMLLMASVVNERGVSASRDAVARRWLWLVVSSLVVMAASSRMFDSVCQGRQFRVEGEFCRELKLGISLAVVSAILAGLMTLLLWFTPEMSFVGWIGVFLALCMMVIWGVLVAYLTFDDGPATTVGNLFFGIWISAIIALDLGVCYFMAWLNI